MDSQILLLFPFFSLTLILKLSLLFQITRCSSNPQWYHNCPNTFRCGAISGIQYPFRGNGDPNYCGYPGLVLNCDQDKNIATMEMANITYRVLGMDQATRIMKIARKDVMETACPQDLVNTTLDYELFDYASNYMNLTFLFGCPEFINFSFHSCGGYSGAAGAYVWPGTQGPGVCNVGVVVPVLETGLGGFFNLPGLDQILRVGLDVRWIVDMKACGECKKSGGRCGYDFAAKQTTCFCPDPPYMSNTCSVANGAPLGSMTMSGNSGSTRNINIVLPVVGAILAGAGIGWLIFFCRQRRKRLAAKVAITENKDLLTPSSKGLTPTPSAKFTQSIPSYPSSISFGKGSTYFGVQVFSYTELEEATDNFDTSRELGDGGFGVVYYGKLLDGREVAVKRLYENNFKRVEQFMNEVEILTRLHHQYLVKLYGCTSKRSRELLLVYEYIPNGTVADHLHGNRAKSGLLSWPVRLKIAIETADALSYLHASDIIHRDVKSNNILLDNSFCVKVADFGLSRLFPNDATHVSTAPQGTPGYVDPEYFQCYKLTDKSDVYSFGVVLIELISSLQAVDTNRHRHDINLSNMAVNKIQNHTLHELVDAALGFETDNSVRRMTTLVAELAFRCLQQEKDMRPTMKEVLDTLRGIENEELNAQKAEVVDVIVDDGGGMALLKDTASPASPDSVIVTKWVSSSTPESSC